MVELSGNNKKIFWVIFSFALLLVGVYLIAWCKSVNTPAPAGPEPVACTMEAKICPDGSAVGRSGPNCEFAACPLVVANPGWLTTSTEGGLSFQYPEMLGTEYISAQTWPAKVELINKAFECTETGSEIKAGGQTVKKMITDKEYCITKASEGAAGSIYITYNYAVAMAEQTLNLNLVLREVQCANYDEPKKAACEIEQSSFDIDSLMDKMVRSVQLK